MVPFPKSPIDPDEFFESFVPKRFAALTLPRPLTSVTLQLGVHLHGHGGGEWLYHLREGDLDVVAGGCDDASFTLIQSVEDWRGTLWEGRGGVVVERGRKLLRPEGVRKAAAVRGAARSAVDSDLVERLADLDGVLEAVVTDGPGGDWSLALQFGPGVVPKEPDTTVRISHADAHKMANGDLPPLHAFLAGRVSVAGDMLLVMQLQALVSELLDGREGA
jgi:hypothetical protein